MISRRSVGIGFIIVGFIIAIAAGLYLAAGELDTSGVILRAGLAFLIVAPLVGLGIYLYTREDEQPETESMMLRQRELVDMLRSRGRLSMAEAAIEMNVTEDAVHEMVRELVNLDVFPGSVDWQNGIIYWQERA